jgi:hypothetical protein
VQHPVRVDDRIMEAVALRLRAQDSACRSRRISGADKLGAEPTAVAVLDKHPSIANGVSILDDLARVAVWWRSMRRPRPDKPPPDAHSPNR